MSTFRVPYSGVNWLASVLKTHKAVTSFEVTDHHYFKILRNKTPQKINAVLVDIYTVGLADVLKALQEFPDANCVVSNGDWTGYTPEAKSYGLENGIGVFTTAEFMGALWATDFHRYHKKDDKGQPYDASRAA